MDKLKFVVKWTFRVFFGGLLVCLAVGMVAMLALMTYFEPWATLILIGSVVGVMMVVFGLCSIYEWATDSL